MKATIVRIHSKHFTIVDREQSPVKRLHEVSMGMAEHHIHNRNLQAECEQWLADNGYFPTANPMEWLKGKQVVVRWTATYETTINVPVEAELDSQTVKDEAANIDIEVKGSTYQSDTWNVDSITNANDPIHA
jgi:hypothetical protein